MKMPNKEKPLISVIVPIYKVEKYLQKCVQEPSCTPLRRGRRAVPAPHG